MKLWKLHLLYVCMYRQLSCSKHIHWVNKFFQHTIIKLSQCKWFNGKWNGCKRTNETTTTTTTTQTCSSNNKKNHLRMWMNGINNIKKIELFCEQTVCQPYSYGRCVCACVCMHVQMKSLSRYTLLIYCILMGQTHMHTHTHSIIPSLCVYAYLSQWNRNRNEAKTGKQQIFSSIKLQGGFSLPKRTPPTQPPPPN